MKNYSKGQRNVSYILSIVAIISVIVGVVLSALAGVVAFMGGYRVFMYFTIQSNIAVAILSCIGIYYISKDRVGKIWPIVKFVGTVSITLTGMVFCFVLAPALGAEAWNIQNILTHVVVPLTAIVDFFVVGQSYSISKKSVFFVIIPPLLYAIYAGIGYAVGWKFSETTTYPYFFLNWGSEAGAFGFSKELPFMGCMWWIIALLIFLILVGLLYLWILDLLKKRK